MKFAKKSLAVILATLMFITSIATGTMAFAADAKTFTSLTSGTTVSVAAKEVTSAGSTSIQENYYYTFVPSVTACYSFSETSTPLYKDSNGYLTTTGSGERADDAYFSVFEKYDATKDEFTDGISSSTLDEVTTGYVYDTATSSVVPTGYNYYNPYNTQVLTKGKTYYIEVRVAGGYDANKKVLGSATFTVAPIDWYVYSYSNSTSVKVTVPTTYNTNGYVTENIETPYCEVRYAGLGKTPVVPETINNAPVKGVYGTINQSITSLTLSKNVEYVADFEGLNYLTSVTLNSGLKEIDSSTFALCTALKSINIPATVKTIGSHVFTGCTALSSLTFDANSSLATIGDYAFYGTALKQAIVPASVTDIGDEALGYETSLNTNTIDPYDTISNIVNGFVLAGETGTEAQVYANRNGIKFIDVKNCTHNYVLTSTTPATVFAAGQNVYTCSVCGATKTEVIAKKTFAIKSLATAKKNAFLVKAAKQSGITGYKVQYSTSNKFSKKTTKTLTVKTKKALSKKVKGLTSGKKYYVRVRAYKVSNKKTSYSKYTKTMSVKVK